MTMRALTGSERAKDEAQPAPPKPSDVVACCGPIEQKACCEPNVKAGCCDEAHPEGCGCR
jgi:hypothetical protein